MDKDVLPDGDDQQDQEQEQSWRFLNLLPCGTDLERSDPQKAIRLYQKAIADNVGSYKLWHAFLLLRTRQLEGKCLDDPCYQEVNKNYEDALVFMHKMPRIWIEYCTLLTRQMFITKTRRAFDKALEALPITQHTRIWPLYLEFIKQSHVPSETSIRIFRRYIQFRPEDAEIFIDYLHSKDRTDEATKLLCDIINRPNFQSKRNKSKFQLWEELCEMICEYADQIESINAEAVLRDGISRYQDQQGRLWNALARYYLHLGMFANARDVYDEAIHKVKTKKDFVEVWEAYTNFEETYLERLLELEDNISQEQLLDLQIRQASLESLIKNNGLLMNRVALRQNPHNVREWQKRAQLCEELEDDTNLKRATYEEALKVIDPKQALGNYEDLWIEYATFLADSGDRSLSCEVFERGIKTNFNRSDELSKVWCSYIEMKTQTSYNDALKLAKRAIASLRNLRLWSLYVDLEENYGSFESAKAAYEQILDFKIATPQIILNYATFLEEKNYFEDSFRVYERGVSLFKWPHSLGIWRTYLRKFITRYGGKKLDRARDLLDKSIVGCPSDYSLEIYLLYAKIEEEYGLLSRALSIYLRASKHVDKKSKALVFDICIKSMMKLADVQTIRNTYEQAIASLDNKDARSFCLNYAKLEEHLGEIDRARTIYSFCSQMCDPRVDREFWALWADFEQRFGGLESIDEMLRIKRSVEALYPRPEYLTDITIESSTIAKAMETKARESQESPSLIEN